MLIANGGRIDGGQTSTFRVMPYIGELSGMETMCD